MVNMERRLELEVEQELEEGELNVDPELEEHELECELEGLQV